MEALQQHALELWSLNLSIVKAVSVSDYESLIQLVADYLDVKKKIKTEFLHEGTLQIFDKKALMVLQKISSGENLPADDIVLVLDGILKSEYKLSDLAGLDDEDFEKLGDELFYCWISHYDFIESLYEIGSLVLSITVPKYLKEFVSEAKNCFAFKQYNSVYALCRTILETSVRDICLRKGFISRNKNVVEIEEYRWSELKNKATRGELRNSIEEIFKEASSIIHGRRVVKADDAKQALKNTLKSVHSLYSYHGY